MMRPILNAHFCEQVNPVLARTNKLLPAVLMKYPYGWLLQSSCLNPARTFLPKHLRTETTLSTDIIQNTVEHSTESYREPLK